MKKIKTILVLLLTAALLLGCAMLPRAAAWVQDRMVSQDAVFADLQSLQLDMTMDSEGREPVSYIIESLSIMQSAYFFPLTEDSMTMLPEQVEDVAMEQLQPYIAAGLLQAVEYDYFVAEPTIAMSSDQLGSYVTFWTVHLVHQDDPYENVLLHLDDKTGTILLIQHEGYSRIFGKEEQAKMLEQLAMCYLEGLSISENLELLNSAAAEVETIELSEEATATRCTLQTQEYGIIQFDFYFLDNGFYTCFPTSPD